MSGSLCEAEVWPVGFDGPNPVYEMAVRSTYRGVLWRGTVIVPMAEADNLENAVVGKLGNHGYNAMSRLRKEDDGYFVTVFDVSTLRRNG